LTASSAAVPTAPTPRRILIVGPGDLASELGRTILWRREIERVHAPDVDAGYEAARSIKPSLLIVDAGGHAEAIAFVRRMRKDPVVRSTGIAVFSRSPSIREEEELRLAGANVVLSGEVDPILWDRRLEEILNVPYRRDARIPVRFKVWSRVEATPDPVEAVALNISVHGMLMETLLSLEVGMKLDLRFELPEQAGEVGVVGEVVRRAGTVEGRPRSGVRFLVRRQDARERIQAFVDSNEPADVHQDGAAQETAEWEAQLRASEAWKAAIFESALDGIITVDHEGRITDFNHAAEKIFGRARADVLGRQAVTTLVPPSLRDDHQQEIARHILAGDSTVVGRRTETLGMRADGTEFPLEMAVTPLEVQGRHLFIAFVRDITDRRRADESLRASGRQFRALFEGSLDAMVVADDEGRYVEVNPAACELHGLPRHALLGHWIGDFAAPGFDFQATWRDLHEKKGVRGEMRLHRADGVQRDLDLVATADFLPGSHLVVLRDVTDRKQLEAQLRQSQKMEAIGRLAGGVAHDFNNLLSVIAGYAELILRALPADSPHRAKAEEILKAASRAAALTRQLLAFSRQQVLLPKVFDLNAVVSEMESMLERLIGVDIELDTRLDPHLGRVRADPGQVEQVVMNLVVNARDAMPDGGRIVLTTSNVEMDEAYVREHLGSRPGPYVLLEVSDNGHGMDAETQAHIFEPFFTTKEKGKGTGLGLATAYGVVKQSGGYIWVESAPSRGTTFHVFLPRVDGVAEAAGPVAVAPAPGFAGETILLVEDQEAVRHLMREILEMSGYVILEAAGGKEAVRISSEHKERIRLMITDVVMPGMSGTELGRQLRALRPEMKVLYISGYADDALHDGVLDDGAAFLQKPVKAAELERVVRRLLE
jgi:two-component system cell cycle sensor histidine kinase/response regulator CckA